MWLRRRTRNWPHWAKVVFNVWLKRLADPPSD
jgi:hypothetical protein